MCSQKYKNNPRYFWSYLKKKAKLPEKDTTNDPKVMSEILSKQFSSNQYLPMRKFKKRVEWSYIF